MGAVWHTDDDKDFRTEVGLDMVGNVLDLMLTDSVREQLGASYGASVGSTMSSDYTDFGYVVADAVVSPTKADVVDKAIADAAASSARQADRQGHARARAQPRAREGAAKPSSEQLLARRPARSRSRSPTGSTASAIG